MFMVRPVQVADIPALAHLAAGASGAHTLPRTAHGMEQAAEHALRSFAGAPDRFDIEARFLLALEPEPGAEIVGCAAMAAAAGGKGAYFSFRNDTIQQVSRDLGISHAVEVLTLASDLSGHSQLSGFVLAGGARAATALLSRSRLLFAALSPQRFADRWFAALPGLTDAHGGSAFWNAVGRKFFGMELMDAERMIEGARDRSAIVELMPPYPVYLPLLPAAAQQALGQAAATAEERIRVLQAEGFETGRHVDIFDGAPILQARRDALHTLNQARRAVAGPALAGPATSCLVACARDDGFRAIATPASPDVEAGMLGLPDSALRRLGLAAGDPVLYVEAS